VKVVILAGGQGTRLGDTARLHPKPMVPIGGRPILWHILSIYAQHGFSDFVLALGHLGHVIKDYLLRAHLYDSNFTISLADGGLEVDAGSRPNWRIHAVDTGLETQTGGRLRRLAEVIGNETFAMTYGDGLADIDLTRLVEFHRQHGKLATVTAVNPPPTFGTMEIHRNRVIRFAEKIVLDPQGTRPPIRRRRINGGFFVLEPQVLDYIDDDATIWEQEPLQRLTAAGQLFAFEHEGFWHSMDTELDHAALERLWRSGNPPWLRR